MTKNVLTVLALLLAATVLAPAQDSHEADGPKDNPHSSGRATPLLGQMQSLHSQLRPELRGQHPRVFVTQSELESLRVRAHTTHRELWQVVLKNLRALKAD